MRKQNESGSLILPFVIVLMLFVGAAGFGVWAFMGRQNYKNNSDALAATAVKQAITVEDSKKDAAFAEIQKSPFKTFTGSSTLGSVTFQYPKMWSAYIAGDSKSSNGAIVDGYFSPDFVSDITTTSSFALRYQVLNQDFTTVMKPYDEQSATGKITASVYIAPKVPNIKGMILRGDIETKNTGTMVLLPERDKTIRIWTEGSDFTNDFNNTILATLTFNP